MYRAERTMVILYLDSQEQTEIGADYGLPFLKQGGIISHMGNERWLPVKGYEEYYEVSDHGRLRVRKTRRGGLSKGTILLPKKMWDGYLTFRFSINKRVTIESAHRTVAKAFIPNPGNKPQINHIDNVRHNNHYTNLEWVTPKENIQHAMKNGNFASSLKNLESGGKSCIGKIGKRLIELGYDISPGMTTTKEGKKKYMDAYHKEKYWGRI